MTTFQRTEIPLGQEYGLSGSSVARLLRVNHLIPEIKQRLDDGSMLLMAAVQLSYLPEQGQRMAVEVSDAAKVPITKEMATNIRKGSMTEKAIREAIAGPDKKVDPLGITETPQERKERKGKTIHISTNIYNRYFKKKKTEEINDIVEKVIIAWFKN